LIFSTEETQLVTFMGTIFVVKGKVNFIGRISGIYVMITTAMIMMCAPYLSQAAVSLSEQGH